MSHEASARISAYLRWKEKHVSRSLRRVLALIFVGSFLLSLAANVGLLRQSRHYKRLFYLTRLDPLGLAAFAGTPPVAEPGMRRVVLFGDSRIAAWSLSAPAGIQIVNRGVAGHSSAQALLRFAEHVAPLRPDLVVVQVGVNDLVAVVTYYGLAWIFLIHVLHIAG